ncbi:MAG: bacillithiol biosynthesis BshC, partial [Candidatus Aminicenantes bacterium]
FDRLIRRPTECTRTLNEAGSKLNELGYSPKIHKKSNICNFFILNEEGKRLRVTYDGKFQVANEAFSQRELLGLLHDNPSRFSANAITRPITQDFLFPTFAYVAGPNEIAYLVQLKGIYDFFGLEMPVIFPRFGATIVEKKVSKILAKYKLEIHELRNPEKILKRLAKEKIDDVFDSFRSEILRGMAEVTRQAKSIDETLIGSCSLARGRILKAIEALEDKIASKLKEHDLVLTRQIAKAHSNLFPYGDLQERQINVLEYIIKFGKEFLRVVYENFSEADYGEHVVIKC